jgi:hypothetical protein
VPRLSVCVYMRWLCVCVSICVGCVCMCMYVCVCVYEYQLYAHVFECVCARGFMREYVAHTRTQRRRTPWRSSSLTAA